MVKISYHLLIFLILSLSLFHTAIPVNAADIKWTITYANANSGDIKIFESNPSIIYASITYGQDQFDLIRSENNGTSWISIKNNLFGHDINWISLHNKNKDIIAVSLWGSGIWLSENYGSSWNLIFPHGNPRSVAIDPTNPDIIYAGIGGTNSAQSGVWKTTDRGKNWIESTAISYRNNSQIVIDPYQNNRVFADGDPNFFKSENSGSSWTTLIPMFAYGDTLVDNENHNIVYTTTYASSQNSSFYKSTDYGNNWKLLNNGLTGSPTRISQDKSHTIYASRVGAGGGVFRSVDQGEHFENISNPDWQGSNTRGIDAKNGRIFVGVEGYGIYFHDESTAPSPNPVVFIPGFLGSWSYKGLIENQPTTYFDWTLTPIFTDEYYQPLLATLKNAGLKDDETLFTFAYDFRKPITDSASDLNTFLTNEVLPKNSGKKVNVASHSMGGLIAHYCYEQVPSCSDKIDKIVTAGTPHQGALKAYPLWEAGQFNEENPIMKVLLEIVLRSQAPYFLTDKDIIQNKIPGVRDLLPIFDYIKGKPYSTLSSTAKNPNLEALSPHPPSFLTSLSPFSGNSFKTDREYTVTQPNKAESTLGLWTDGKIKSTNRLTDGDGTVSKLSSEVTGSDNKYYPMEHKDYFRSNSSLSDLLTTFNLSGTVVTKTTQPSSFLTFIIHSPAKISVTDQNGSPVGINMNGQAVFIGNPTDQKYQIILNGTDAIGEEFQLESYVSNPIYPPIHSAVMSDISLGQTKTLYFNPITNPHSFTDPSGNIHWESFRKSLSKITDPPIHNTTDHLTVNNINAVGGIYLYLINAASQKSNPSDRNNIFQAANSLLALLDQKQTITSIPPQTQLKKSFSQAQLLINITSNYKNLTMLQAANILLAQEFLDRAKLFQSYNKPHLSHLLAQASLLLASP